MKKRKCVLGSVLILIVCVVILPYARVEILTALHKGEFETEYTQTHMVDDIEYLKVINYSGETANVYYVLKNHAAAILVTLERSDNNWTIITWKTVWSKTGSASEFIWPYYW